MNKTLRISFALRNTYRVNSILYALKQIPLVKRLLPDTLYQVRGLKVFANVLSVLWEIISAFLGKLVYLAVMVFGAGMLYTTAPREQVFLHLLVLLTILGAFVNTFMFNPSKDKYYAMILMRMDAKDYTLVNYGYAILKVLAGFLPFCILLGTAAGVPLWICLLIPFFVAGLKMTVAAFSLWDYEKHGTIRNENGLDRLVWAAVAILLALAYGLPAFGIVLPVPVCVGFMALCILSGAASVRRILAFGRYRELYRQILAGSMNQMDAAKQRSLEASQKFISADAGITSRKKGFEYLNDLFIKRHKKILWKASQSVAIVCVVLIIAVLTAFQFLPEFKEQTNELLMVFLPYFVFIMYAINRGTGFTRALFMNCDHSLLTYSFYKQPKMVLKLFGIRLREIIKINLLPAAVIGAGLALLLWASGGTDNPVNYAVLFISIICMSIFFSVHYLMIYYLLQPYNAATEMKNATYQIVLTATYLVCFYMMRLRMPTLVFGLLTIVFCVLYCVVACILVYRLAPKTFRLRS